MSSEWTCSACTFVNKPQFLQCEVCSAIKIQPTPPPMPPQPPPGPVPPSLPPPGPGPPSGPPLSIPSGHRPRHSISGSSTGTLIKVHIPSGEKVTVRCENDMLFGALKDLLWKKKKLVENQNEYVFRIVNGEIFFRDEQRLERYFEIAPVFREKHVVVHELLVVHQDDRGDQIKRRDKRADNSPITICGYLYKKGAKFGAVGWRRRWFVVQGPTLFYYVNDTVQREGKQAIDSIAMGGCTATLVESQYKGNPCFELKAEGVGKRNVLLSCESKTDLDKWMKAFHIINFRRVKSISVSVCEELRTRGLKQEGLFRKSGNSETLQKLKHDFDMGEYPQLSDERDEYCIAALLKMAIREMQEPLLTFSLYQEFLSLSSMSIPKDKKAEKAREIIEKLPISNQVFLEYLLNFMQKVAAESRSNLMNYKNLAIVLAPNILRPEKETAQTTMTDNKAVLEATEILLEQSDAIFPRRELVIGERTPPDDNIEIVQPTEESGFSLVNQLLGLIDDSSSTSSSTSSSSSHHHNHSSGPASSSSHSHHHHHHHHHQQTYSLHSTPTPTIADIIPSSSSFSTAAKDTMSDLRYLRKQSTEANSQLTKTLVTKIAKMQTAWDDLERELKKGDFNIEREGATVKSCVLKEVEFIQSLFQSCDALVEALGKATKATTESREQLKLSTPPPTSSNNPTPPPQPPPSVSIPPSSSYNTSILPEQPSPPSSSPPIGRSSTIPGAIRAPPPKPRISGTPPFRVPTGPPPSSVPTGPPPNTPPTTTPGSPSDLAQPRASRPNVPPPRGGPPRPSPPSPGPTSGLPHSPSGLGRTFGNDGSATPPTVPPPARVGPPPSRVFPPPLLSSRTAPPPGEIPPLFPTSPD